MCNRLSRGEAHELAVKRAAERARIASLSDAALAGYLGNAVLFGARVSFRAAWHEAVIVRGAAGIPRWSWS